MLNDSKSYRQRHHWVAENKRKKKTRETTGGFFLSHRGEPDNARHFSNAVQMPGKCAHAKKATEYTIDCFVFVLPELFFFFWVIPRCAERQSTGGKNSFVCVCVSSFVTSSGWASENIPAHPLSFSHHQMKGKAMQKVMGQHNAVVCWRPISSTKEGEPFSFDSL